jgi:hypothetical protein
MKMSFWNVIPTWPILHTLTWYRTGLLPWGCPHMGHHVGMSDDIFLISIPSPEQGQDKLGLLVYTLPCCETGLCVRAVRHSCKTGLPNMAAPHLGVSAAIIWAFEISIPPP